MNPGLSLLIRLGLLAIALWAIAFDQPWRSLIIIPCLLGFVVLTWKDSVRDD